MPEPMDQPARIRALYEVYIDRVETLERNRKPGEGIFGLKGGPADDPCHDRFAADLEALLGEFARSDPAPAEIRQVLEYMYSVPLAHRDSKTAYWMLIAVHGLALDLAERLPREESAPLRAKYAGDYPRWERLPVQKQTLAALKK